MRVALLTHNARTGDAVGNQVAAKAAFFRDRGADVRAFVESDRDLQPSLRPLLRAVSVDEALPALAAELTQFDLLCIEYSQYYRLLDVLPLLGGRRPKVLADYHGVTPPELWAGPPGVLRESQRQRGLVWFADEVAVHSHFMRRELESATHYPGERIHQLPLYLEITAREADHHAPSLRHRLGLTDARILLFVGRLAANKRVPILIEAVAQLTDERPEIHAVIVGDTSDLYQTEFERCRDRAARFGVADRVHFLGRVSHDDLANAYRAADLFVVPSKHEGFCVPVIEAMAHGVPVIAARAAALPETLGDAGFSFAPDDAADLAQQIRRVWEPQAAAPAQPDSQNIAIVAARYGDEALGGAERSLRLVAESLAEAGHRVDVFTTGTGAGVETIGGVRVHRFPTDPVDSDALAACTQQLSLGQNVADQTIHNYFTLTSTSSRLIAALQARWEEFHAIIAGPYASGLTWAVAERFPDQTVLLACFHDEPLARQPLVRDGYSRVAGLLYHSAEERAFAQIELGLHHPNAEIIGTWLGESPGNPERGRAIAGQSRDYVVYCGRYCREKNVPTLIDWIQRYAAEQPGRFGAVFTGTGEAAFPPTISDLGFLSDADKTDVVAGASALVLLSRNESLSLAALEAWREAVPVISHSACAVLAGHQRRSGGGVGVGGYEEFRDALNDLCQNPDGWREKGKRGREYVKRDYSDRTAFVSQLKTALNATTEPLAATMRRKGLQRAAAFTPRSWAAAFAEQVERVLDREPIKPTLRGEISASGDGRSLTIFPTRGRVTVELRNTGTVALLRGGAAECAVWSRVYSADGTPLGPAVATRLPENLVPGQTTRLAVRLAAPPVPGTYVIGFRVGTKDSPGTETQFSLVVTEIEAAAKSGAALDGVQAALADAESIAELPAGYADVTEGRFAAWKRAIKRSVLHQFQTSYVDVLSRQQSAFNRSVLAAVQELAECAATLERAVMDGAPAEPAAPDLAAAVARLNKRVRQAVGRINELEQRLERLEALVSESVEAESKEGRS